MFREFSYIIYHNKLVADVYRVYFLRWPADVNQKIKQIKIYKPSGLQQIRNNYNVNKFEQFHTIDD